MVFEQSFYEITCGKIKIYKEM